MDVSSIELFRSDVAAQRTAIAYTFDLVENRAGVAGDAGLESLSFQLHNLYSACEDLFELIASAFENHIDPGGGYHVELLRRMKASISGVRPSVISDETCRLLDSLRAFRHVFRHAYGVPLDRRRVEIVLDDARRLKPVLNRDIDRFLASVPRE